MKQDRGVLRPCFPSSFAFRYGNLGSAFDTGASRSALWVHHEAP